ncbi:MAG: hypothetical protein BGO98_23330 [Myxococcales bacterium 68-20]|nr:hypothetical protein [Myxococcales bacterium]OJY15616.1 MAG: hypothetical protein BGO98_23330 [Myxococcales bacterium 68-20]
MVLAAEPLDEIRAPTPAALSLGEPVEVLVHDATRLAWNVTVPLTTERQTHYSFELELEVPANLVGVVDLWSALESYARLDDAVGIAQTSGEAFRRSVATISSKLARARDGFVRHCALIQSSATVEENHAGALRLWLAAMSAELANARSAHLEKAAEHDERRLADEFLSIQLWAMLTDCARSLLELRRTLDERGQPGVALLDEVEATLAGGLKDEIAYRWKAEFVLAEPVNTLQLERFLSRMRWLKKHFEHVCFLDIETYQVAHRLGGWFSALAAMLAYLWFVLVQIAVASRPSAIGSGVVVLALATALAYVSRDRLKELGRNWLAGRVQRMFAQRVTRYRMPRRERQRGSVVVAARESFSQSGAERLDPSEPGSGAAHDVTLFRFMHRGVLTPPTSRAVTSAAQVRLMYRLDLSWLFPRLHDAVRGFASIDEHTGGIAIVDVPRNYELPIRVSVERPEGAEKLLWTLIVNKNGLVRVAEGEAAARGALVPHPARGHSS